MELSILNRQVLHQVPSASGIAKAANDFYVIGDNTQWIFKLNDHFQVAEKFAIANENTDSIIPKNVKPDFEAMTVVKWGTDDEILVFGSGSKLPERNQLVRFNPAEPGKIRRYSLEQFYGKIKSSTGLDDSTLNIEAAAASGNQLFLFNRERNILLQCDLNHFIRYIEGTGEFPVMKEYAIKLPVMNNIQATFSGASIIPQTNTIIFTASVENNQNPVDDGEIVGSYLGIIQIEELKDHYQPRCVMITDMNQPLKIKVESVEILANQHSSASELILVTDSDGGVSEIIRARLTWN